LLLIIFPVKRTGNYTDKLVTEVKERTNNRTDLYLTSDEHSPYKTAIKKAYTEKGKLPKELVYATVRKDREKGRVVNVTIKLILGTMLLLNSYLTRSTVSKSVNTAFVERHNGTDRHQNKRKQRKTYCFSKNLDMHESLSYFIAYSYNFCWAVRTLRIKKNSGSYKQRTPAMAAGLSDHIWSTAEWVKYPTKKN